MYEIFYTKILFATIGFDFSILEQLNGFEKIKLIINNVANVATLALTWGFALYFLIKLLISVFSYFSHGKDYRKREDSKEAIQSSFSGLIVVLISKYLIKVVLFAIGLQSNLIPFWL